MMKDDKEKPRNQRYLDSVKSLEELVDHLSAEEQREWKEYGHLRVEPAFQDRILVLYKATGRDNAGNQRAPKIIDLVRVLSFVARDETGCIVRVESEKTGKVMEVDHVPKKLFGYPVFISIPPMFTLRWDVREHAGKTLRSLSYLLFLKTRNKATFYAKDNFYVETPNSLKTLYPEIELDLQ